MTRFSFIVDCQVHQDRNHEVTRVLPATFSSRSIVDCEEMGTLLRELDAISCIGVIFVFTEA